jgi:hypothetical protein
MSVIDAVGAVVGVTEGVVGGAEESFEIIGKAAETIILDLNPTVIIANSIMESARLKTKVIITAKSLRNNLPMFVRFTVPRQIGANMVARLEKDQIASAGPAQNDPHDVEGEVYLDENDLAARRAYRFYFHNPAIGTPVCRVTAPTISAHEHSVSEGKSTKFQFGDGDHKVVFKVYRRNDKGGYKFWDMQVNYE